MAVDPSKLKKPVRRSLGAPPTDGSPGIEDNIRLASDNGTPPAALSLSDEGSRPDAPASAAAMSMPRSNHHPPPTPTPKWVASTPTGGHDHVRQNGADEESLSQHVDDEGLVSVARRAPASGRERGDQPISHGRQRVPPPEAEARIPFTTRVSVSTKERLEDACHYLRMKHQDFINQAIVAHLKKNGF